MSDKNLEGEPAHVQTPRVYESSLGDQLIYELTGQDPEVLNGGPFIGKPKPDIISSGLGEQLVYESTAKEPKKLTHTPESIDGAIEVKKAS